MFNPSLSTITTPLPPLPFVVYPPSAPSFPYQPPLPISLPTTLKLGPRLKLNYHPLCSAPSLSPWSSPLSPGKPTTPHLGVLYRDHKLVFPIPIVGILPLLVLLLLLLLALRYTHHTQAYQNFIYAARTLQQQVLLHRVSRVFLLETVKNWVSRREI